MTTTPNGNGHANNILQTMFKIIIVFRSGTVWTQACQYQRCRKIGGRRFELTTKSKKEGDRHGLQLPRIGGMSSLSAVITPKQCSLYSFLVSNTAGVSPRTQGEREEGFVQ